MPVDVEITIPVYNEVAALERSVRELHRFLAATFPFTWRIVIADNASTDGTLDVARELVRELPEVDALRIPLKGRGGALRASWSLGDASVLCYMDADLSTELTALLPLVAPLISGHSDIAIGTRLHRNASVTRSARREALSRGYNLLLRMTLSARFSDAQCGFKAIRADLAEALVSEVRDDGWFFDTELLVLAQRRGLRIHEVPVDWVEDPDSSVAILRTALSDLRGVRRLTFPGPSSGRASAARAVSVTPHADGL
jgi:glycosyltransferase involved in cell wall biosynthesis